MNNFLIGFLVLAAMLVMAQAQCPGRPWSPACYPPRNNGYRGRGCTARTMWWYENASNSCKSFWYMGCGGNRNRWCSQRECEMNCMRRG
ncbi:male accessory gland serine protease inhibitor-like [Musca autumnalis]|uniref:male accessory gland serine protease inhibitor-like n=1 Tax=Musca autumnalis TaxID=221902 RepID=UPI003CEA2376